MACELGSVGTLRGRELGGGWDLRLEDPRLTTRKALSDGHASLLGALPTHQLVTGALFFVSQGSWVRSSFHLHPRMIG